MGRIAEMEGSKELTVPEMLETAARVNKFYKEFSPAVKAMVKLMERLDSEIRYDVVSLTNIQNSMRAKNRDLEILIARNEREAQSRLATVDMGHRALTDRLRKAEQELSAKTAELEKEREFASRERHNYELRREEYDRKLAGLERVARKQA